MANVTLGTLRDYWKGVYDAVKTAGAAHGTTGMQVAGSDGTNARIIKTNEAGEVLTQLSGSILQNETNKAVTATTDILIDYTATKTMQTTLMVETNTSGVLSLEVDGVLASLNGGTALDTGKWYAFDIPILAASVYNLQFSAGATMQIKWIGGF